MGCIYLLLLVLQLLYLISWGYMKIYHYGFNNETSQSKNIFNINVNEMDDDWGQYVNIEII